MSEANPKPRDEPLESAVITKATLRAATNLGIPNRVLGKTLGVSEATVSRLRSGQKQIEKADKTFELAALFVRMYRSLDAITGGDDGISSRWLYNDNAVLNARPVDMIVSVQGLINVIQYLDSRRAVI